LLSAGGNRKNANTLVALRLEEAEPRKLLPERLPS
jgi:hypothetical protein